MGPHFRVVEKIKRFALRASRGWAYRLQQDNASQEKGVPISSLVQQIPADKKHQEAIRPIEVPQP